MENKQFSLLGVLMAVTLLLLSSCVKIAEPIHSDFKLERSSQTLYGNAIQIRFNSGKTSETASFERKMSEKCEKDMMHWADYSSLDSNY